MGNNLYQFPIYDIHVYNALKVLSDLGPNGIEQLRAAMSVLLYRLSKILCSDPPPAAVPIGDLLKADMQAHVLTKPGAAELQPALDKALAILVQVTELAGYYAVDRVLMRTRPNDTDNMAKDQHPSLRNMNRPHSAWGRVLPFRPMFCLFGVFSVAFPVLSNAKAYDDVPREDSILFEGGDDKPNVREDKQRSFATLTDAVDYKVGIWKSHTKSEQMYLGGAPLMSSPAQRPRRIGRCYWRKAKGSISPDLMIVRRRHLAPTPDNVTHCVDMKFGGDELGKNQENKYQQYFGGKLVVLYFPTDCQRGEPEETAKEGVPDWVKALMALLLLLALRKRGGGPRGGLNPAPVHVPN
jgi:hypothetical protein